MSKTGSKVDTFSRTNLVAMSRKAIPTAATSAIIAPISKLEAPGCMISKVPKNPTKMLLCA